jgi:ABC-type uncharacterized transport system substrate-binding protein
MKRLVIVLVCVMVLAPFTGVRAEDKKFLVYIVNSYNPETFGWTAEEDAGILTGFETQGLKQGVHYEIIRETMDALVKSSEDEMKSEAARILADIKEKQPDLVMTTDDDALQWVGLEIDEIPVVFNGVNGVPTKYLASPLLDSVEKPGHNMTGVYQITYFQQSLEFIQQLVPDAKTFAVITDTSTTSFALLEDIKSQADTLPLTLQDTLVSAKFTDWKRKIQEWQDTVDCLFLFSNNAVEDENGEVMPAANVTAWLQEHSTLPDTAPWAYQVQDGVLVSASDSGELQGVYSALLATEILNGANPGDLAIVTPPNGVPVLNGARVEQLGLTIPEELLTVFID